MSNVGCRLIEVNDAVQQVQLPVRLLYPTNAIEALERCGPKGLYEISVAMNAPITAGRYPLVLISHDGGGSSLTYRDLAMYLARSGRVVALVEHLGDCRDDNSLDRTIANLENRPRHIRLVLDALLQKELSAHILADKIAVIGHSMGGYTALAIVGGKPTSGPFEQEGAGHAISVTSDPRVRALVLMAPACAWYGRPGALSGVDLPILLFTAEKDHLGPHLFEYRVRNEVKDPSKVIHREIANAGHFSFQSQFPASMTRPDFPPSQDPLGFDRVGFQQILQREIVSFLDAHL
jgi:predicted dienelactone hydrolase